MTPVAVLLGERHTVSEAAVRQALDTVLDPELDEPITHLGFVRSVSVDHGSHDPASATPITVTVHLRLPTSFCAPNFAYLMCADSKDALSLVRGVDRVVVERVDHHDSDLINAGLAADAGYVGTFGHEAEQGLDDLRTTFRRKAHTAAMERCLTDVLRSDPTLPEEAVAQVRLGQLPPGRHTDALLRRRAALGLPAAPDAFVLVDDEGRGYEPTAVPMALRRARATRISIDGNAHFCRGLLRTRYGGSAADQAPRLEGAEPADHHRLIPVSLKEQQQ